MDTPAPTIEMSMRELKPGQCPGCWQIRPTFLPGANDLRDAVVEARSTRGATHVEAARICRSLFDGGSVERIGKVQDPATAHESLFVIILDVHVDDMDGSIQGRAASVQVIDDGVPASLLARNDNVYIAALGTVAATIIFVLQARHAHLPVLPALRAPFDVAIPPEHV